METKKRGLPDAKSSETGAILNHTTLSVWAATFILCGVFVFGLHQLGGRLDGIQAALEQSEQDKKLLLEGMDELLVRAERPNQLLASAEPPGEEAETEPPPPQPPEQDGMEKSEPNDFAKKYKIYYRMKAGEDLTQVSEKFSVSEDQLRLWNALKTTDSLIPGQVLVINKNTKTDTPVVVGKAPPPTEAERVDKTEEPAPEGKDVADTDPAEGTGDSLAAGGEEQTPEAPEEVADEPVDGTVHKETSLATTEVRHKVQRGENLCRIGRLYDLSWEEIARANGITDPSLLYVGQVLKIPVAEAAPGE